MRWFYRQFEKGKIVFEHLQSPDICKSRSFFKDGAHVWAEDEKVLH